jgi:hypothetical protein
MSSVNFDDLAAEFPEERQAIKGLEALFAAKRPLEVSFDHLVAKLRPHSVEALALLLSELVEAGLVRRKIRVESPSRGGGIGDFDPCHRGIPVDVDLVGQPSRGAATASRRNALSSGVSRIQ